MHGMNLLPPGSLARFLKTTYLMVNLGLQAIMSGKGSLYCDMAAEPSGKQFIRIVVEKE